MNAEVRNRIQGIATAIFKVASVVGHNGLRLGLESAAVSLASSATKGTISAAENLIALGRNVGEIKSINAVILFEELKIVRESISEARGASADIDISSYLEVSASPKEKGSRSSVTSGKEKIASSAKSRDLSSMGDSAISRESDREVANSEHKARGSANSDKVFLYIREHGQARLKELEAVFPDISGRTIRRMTEGLIKDSKIERVGNPGPTSFYRVRKSYMTASPEAAPAPASSAGAVPAHLTPLQSVIGNPGYHLGASEPVSMPVRNITPDNSFSLRNPF